MAPHANYYMPSESHIHSRTLTAWPDLYSIENGKDLKGAENDIAAISNAIVKYEPVTLFCKSSNLEKAKNLVSPEVEIQELEVEELWIRDSGPVYVRDKQGKLAGLDFNFNYWGNKYEGDDSAVARRILDHQNITRIQLPFVAEGGAIEVDGDGTLLVTTSSIINDNRNPGLSKQDVEKHVKEYLGVDKVLWLAGVKGQDITDWHVDSMARFVSPGRVLLTQPPTSSAQFVLKAYAEAKEVLARETDARDRKIQVVELAEADPALFNGEDGFQLVLSYLNYLLVNGGVVIPAFGDKIADDNARRLFVQLYPERLIEQVHLSTIRRLGGGIHCATQQQPKLST